MITVRGRQLVIPRDENVIGTTYDDHSEVRHFLIDRVTTGGIDLSHLHFRLDLEYQGEKKDTSLLDVEVREDSILLTWTIPRSCLATAGTVWIAIRGYDDNGTVKWATNKGAVYVEDTIDTPGSNPPGLTELEQLERRIEEKTETLDANEGERQQNETIRQENEQRRQNNEAEWQKQAEAAISQANTTLQGANAAMEAAQGSETSAAESATAANASKEAAEGSASAAEESAAEAQRISQGFAGFDGTALSVPAVDVQGLVGQAGSTSNVQALMNYLAVKVAQELVSNEALTTMLLNYVTKSSIVQTESTDPTTVPSSPYFKQVADKLTSDLGGFQFYATLEALGITGTDFTYQVFVDRMPVNAVLICRVSGLTFMPTNGEFYLRATCTGYPESKRIEFEAIEMSSSLSGVYKARYSAPAGTKWSGWKSTLTNADIYYASTSVENNYNNYIKGGLYQITGSVATNSPTGQAGSGGILIVFEAQAYVIQFAFNLTTAYYRRYTKSTVSWSAWKTFTST